MPKQIRGSSLDYYRLLVGAAAMKYPTAWREDEPGSAYAIISERDLNFVRKRSVSIRTRKDGSVRVDVRERRTK